MTWEIVVGLITLFTFVIMIGKVVSNNTAVITELRLSVDNLVKATGKQEKMQEKLYRTVGEHETRICILEEKEKSHE